MIARHPVDQSRKEEDMPYHLNKDRKRRVRTTCLMLSLFLLLLMIGGGVLGFAYVNTTLLTPVTKFIHPVSRGKDEPVLNEDTSLVTGRTWNILLLGSENDGKFNFPALLTQVMMIVHIDPAHHSVSLVSIPRDSWVYVPEVGGMHKIDQAFFLGATQHNNFDDGVRLARLTVEKDYGITIDRYAWVGLSGFASVIIPICVLRATSKMREVGHRTEAFWIGFQLIKSVTDLVNDLIERGQREIRQVFFAHFFPDMFDRIKLRTVGRLSNQSYIGRNLELF
jgi:hypothetical protein